jgi:hypothetical protein
MILTEGKDPKEKADLDLAANNVIVNDPIFSLDSSSPPPQEKLSMKVTCLVVKVGQPSSSSTSFLLPLLLSSSFVVCLLPTQLLHLHIIFSHLRVFFLGWFHSFSCIISSTPFFRAFLLRLFTPISLTVLMFTTNSCKNISPSYLPLSPISSSIFFSSLLFSSC